jgi:signal transduction histidine kinase
MKLLNRTSKYYAIATLLVFLIGSIVFYFALKTFVNDDIVGKLDDEKLTLETQVASYDSIPQVLFSVGDDIIITKTEPANYTSNTITKDTILFDEKEGNEEAPARSIQFYAKSKFNTYRITIVKSLIENDDLIGAIGISLFTLIIFLLIIIYFINRKISKIIWAPFYDSLNKIKKFDVSYARQISLGSSDISEFSELNKAITLMTDKIQTDYKNLKEFTENASHEIQTPLAIINTKLELLIQTDNLEEEQMHNVQSVYDAAKRLSKLNQSLILLTKIENNQFVEKEQINFSETVKKHIANYNELVTAKKINITSNISYDIQLKINSSLADILISNLITNAIKHNIENGEIKVELLPGNLKISNTGAILHNNPIELFERFKKDKSASESLGLGLSIVKKICETEHIQINYSSNANYHIVELKF